MMSNVSLQIGHLINRSLRFRFGVQQRCHRADDTVNGNGRHAWNVPAQLVVAKDRTGRTGQVLADNHVLCVLITPFFAVTGAEDRDGGPAESRREMRES